MAKGDSALAEQRGRVIAAVERTISQLVDRTIRFVLCDEPLEVRISQDSVELSLDVLPDGLKSITSWLADLLMRLDRLPWKGQGDILQRSFVCFLDEIDVHMHPAWQRKVLPVVQRLFPNAQIFLSTHSPLVAASVSDAWIHPLTLNDGKASPGKSVPACAGDSYPAILDTLFGVDEWDIETEKLFKRFHELKRLRLAGDNSVHSKLDQLADMLRKRSLEARDIIEHEMRQLMHRLEKAS